MSVNRLGFDRRSALLLFLFALLIRLPGIGWGIVTAADGHAYLPERYEPEPPRVVYTYATDESSFRLRTDSAEIRELVRSGDDGSSFLGRLPGLLSGLQIGYPLASAPVSPILYAGWTFFIGGLRRLLGDSEPWLYTFYTSGRYLTALIGAATAPIVLWLYRRYFATEGEPPGISLWVGILTALIPAHVALSHWISYNPIITLIEIILFGLILELTRRMGGWSDRSILSHALLTGAVLGLGLATKPVIVTIVVPLLAAALLASLHPNRTSRSLSLPRALAAVSLVLLSALFLAGLLLLYSYLFDREALNLSLANYLRNLAGERADLGALRSPIDLLGEYLQNTLILGTGIGIGLGGLAGIFTLFDWKRGSVMEPARFLLLLWFLTLGLSLGTNSTGLHIGRNLTPFVHLVLFCGLFVQWLRRRGWSRLVAPISVAVALSALFVSLSVDLFYMTDQNRRVSSRWILENVPEGSRFLSLHESGPTWASPEILRLDSDRFVPTGPSRYTYETQDVRSLEVETEGRSLSQIGGDLRVGSQRLLENYQGIVTFICASQAAYLETSTSMLQRFGRPVDEMREQIEACGFRLAAEFPALPFSARALDPLLDALYGSRVIYIYERELP